MEREGKTNRKEGRNQTWLSFNPPKSKHQPKSKCKKYKEARYQSLEHKRNEGWINIVCYIKAGHQNQQIQRQEPTCREFSAIHLSYRINIVVKTQCDKPHSCTCRFLKFGGFEHRNTQKLAGNSLHEMIMWCTSSTPKVGHLFSPTGIPVRNR